MIATKNKSEDPPRLLIRTKCNLGEDGGAFGYDLIAGPLVENPKITATRVAWDDFIEGSPKSLLAMAEGELPIRTIESVSTRRGESVPS
jgi:hypothetical protein